MMNLILWLIAGAVIGWLAGVVMNERGSLVTNIVVGVVGAVLGGLLLGGATINSDYFSASGAFSMSSLVVSFIGAVVLLAIVNLVQRDRVR
jgi:uncharacterized membrane protein YeaQ/YmgE (transglycosylase-associated protein family)